MDLVYICRDGRNEELRYSIRSAVANLPHDNIWVVGGKPDWYIGNHIRIKQNGLKFDNARNNLSAACRNSDISNDFILMNDDFFIMDKIENLLPYHRGTLEEHINSITQSLGYKRLLEETLDTLKNIVSDRPIYSYEIHGPMVMDKQNLAKVLRMPGLWRSIYGNICNVGGEVFEDVKIHSGQTSNDVKSKLPFMSTNDETFLDFLPILERTFSTPTKYEKKIFNTEPI